MAFTSSPAPDAAARRQILARLKQALLRHQDRLVEAMSRDFASRSADESRMLDILMSVLAIDHAHKHVRRWMRPSRRSCELPFTGNRVEVRYQPKGVVGIIGTWNFPVYVVLGPLAAALAAGNRALIKMPENTPATNAALRTLLGEVAAEDQIALVGEELLDPSEFSTLPFDHIVFTGSPRVGRKIMQAAAQSLTPVTLELGGKSPAIVDPDADLRMAARSIAHGKWMNAGQVCVAPDYVLAPSGRVAEFIVALKDAHASFGRGALSENPDCTSIISESHAARLRHLLDDAHGKGAAVTRCGPPDDGTSRKMPLHIVTNCSEDMALLHEEIFGPVLPVIPYDTLEDVIRFVGRRPRPLALYVFGHDHAWREKLLLHTHSGGVTLNDCAWHAVNHDAPFGGIGNSGMGSYHGVEGFRELSHARTVFHRRSWFPTHWFHPPYGTAIQKVLLRLYLGAGQHATTSKSARLATSPVKE